MNSQKILDGQSLTSRIRHSKLTILLFLILTPFLHAGSPPPSPARVLTIPKIKTPPTLEDFLEMKPSRRMEGRMAKVEGFTQRLPSDGAPVSERTEAYVAYDDKNFYCVFVAFDTEPNKIRVHKTPHDIFEGDDKLDLFLDTYDDHRWGYVFTVNALGYQMDGLWTEGLRAQYNNTFDTIWYSRGQMTRQGFVVWMAIPFKSLRFPTTPKQTWGIVFIRWIMRRNESATWPWISTRIEGRLTQEATLVGLKDITPARNVQLIPYGFARSYRALDQRDPNKPRFVSKGIDPNAGVDAKAILKDAFTLDATVNPDFSQVESDQPQISVNRRFETYFPEKRPFFLDNPSYFETPINLFFTRRIADPQFGVRLTGKQGPYTVGALLSDDQSPGEIVPPEDPLAGKRAFFSVVRVSRDILQESSVGAIYADREFAGTFNRVGGPDVRFKVTRNWWASGQALASATTFPDGTRQAGPAYKVQVRRDGRQFYCNFDYNDRSPGFDTETGFLAENVVERLTNLGRTIYRPPLRTDMRNTSGFVTYRFRPEGKYLISWGPNVFVNPNWDHRNTRLDMFHDYSLSWEFSRQTMFELFSTGDRELLRPQDFAGLTVNRAYYHQRNGLYFETSFIPQVTFKSEYGRGTQINVVPPKGSEPFLANLTSANVTLQLRPVRRLHIDNTYLLERLTSRANAASVYNNHIVRSEWGWQFNRELALRVILQYSAVLANPGYTSLKTTKNFNADFLVSYFLNPFTALYVGYNGNADNLALLPTATGSELLRTLNLRSDTRQFFIKFSYFFRL